MSALVTHLNAGNLSGLPTWSGGPRFGDAHYWEAVKTAGYTGVQHYWPENEAMAAGLTMSGMGRVTAPEAMRPLAAQHKAWGFVATTLHVGTGLETDIEMDRLAAAVLDASQTEPAELRRQVTSPGGTTEAALKVLMGEGGLGDLLDKAVKAAVARSRELAG